jgi:hypothetical protein
MTSRPPGARQDRGGRAGVPRRALPLPLGDAGRHAATRDQPIDVAAQLPAEPLGEVVDRLAHALGLHAAADDVPVEPDLAFGARGQRDARVGLLLEHHAGPGEWSLHGRIQLAHLVSGEIGDLRCDRAAGDHVDVHVRILPGSRRSSHRSLPARTFRSDPSSRCAQMGTPCSGCRRRPVSPSIGLRSPGGVLYTLRAAFATRWPEADFRDARPDPRRFRRGRARTRSRSASRMVDPRGRGPPRPAWRSAEPARQRLRGTAARLGAGPHPVTGLARRRRSRRPWPAGWTLLAPGSAARRFDRVARKPTERDAPGL